MKKLLSVLVLALTAIGLTFTGCDDGGSSGGGASPTGEWELVGTNSIGDDIEIDDTDITLYQGDEIQLGIALKYDNGTTKNIDLDSAISNGDVKFKLDSAAKKYLDLTADEGLLEVTGMPQFGANGVTYNYGYGKLKVTYKSKSVEYTVFVNNTSTPTVKSIYISNKDLFVAKGRTLELAVSRVMSDGSENDITDKVKSGEVKFESDDEDIATIKGNILTGKDADEVVITATYELNGDEWEAEKTFTVIDSEDVDDYNIDDVVITGDNSVYVGSTDKLTATVWFEGGDTFDATNIATWASSDTSVAVVSSTGAVTGISKGSAVITATVTVLGEEVEKTFNINVQEVTKIISVTSVTFDTADEQTIHVGESIELSATATLSDGSTKAVSDITISSGKDFATLEGTTLKATGEGTVKVTASYSLGEDDEDDKEAELTIYIVKKDESLTLESIAVEPTSKTLEFGDTVTLTVTAKFEDQNGKTSTATASSATASAQSAAVTIRGLTITGANSGDSAETVTVTVSYTYGSVTKTSVTKTAECTVTSNPIKVTSITVSPTEVTSLAIGATTALTVKANGTTTLDNTKVTFASSDDSIATVTNGVIKGVKAGTAKITASYSGQTATCTVTVKALEIKSILVQSSGTSGEVSVNKGSSIGLSVIPVYETGDKGAALSSDVITFTSDDESVATVSTDGTVTGVEAGSATITAKYGSLEGTINVKVSGDEEEKGSGSIGFNFN